MANSEYSDTEAEMSTFGRLPFSCWMSVPVTWEKKHAGTCFTLGQKVTIAPKKFYFHMFPDEFG